MSRVILCLEIRESCSLYILCVVSIFFFFAHGLIKYEWFLSRSIWPLNRTLKGITTLGQSGPESNKGVHHTTQSFKTETLPPGAV